MSDFAQKHFVLSLSVILTTLVFSIYAFAAVIISFETPTEYTDGTPLDQSLIDHFAVCAMRDGEKCDYIYQISADSTQITNYPEWAHQVRARTVLKNGSVSDWSNPITVGDPVVGPDKKPDPPILTVSQ